MGTISGYNYLHLRTVKLDELTCTTPTKIWVVSHLGMYVGMYTEMYVGVHIETPGCISGISGCMFRHLRMYVQASRDVCSVISGCISGLSGCIFRSLGVYFPGH